MPQEAAKEEPLQRGPRTPGPWWGPQWGPGRIQGILRAVLVLRIETHLLSAELCFLTWGLCLKFCAVESILNSTWNYFFGLSLYFKCHFLHVECNSQIHSQI